MQNSNRPSSYKKMTKLQKIGRINRNLRLGDITRIAESTGYSQSYVSYVASGKYENEEIVNSLYELTRNRASNPRSADSRR